MLKRIYSKYEEIGKDVKDIILKDKKYDLKQLLYLFAIPGIKLQCKEHNNCRECKYTTKMRYAKDISKEKTRIELKQELKERDKEIEEYKQTIRRLVNGENIYNFKTLNEIRKIYNLKPIGLEYYKETN